MAQRISNHPFQRRALAGVSLAFTLAAGVMPTTTFAQQGPMKIHLHIDGAIATATLDNNAAARDFVAQLPLSLTLQNYAEIERIATLPRKLSTPAASMGMTPVTGDIAYYAPWGNLAIYLSSTVHDRGLVRLGKVDSGLAALQRPGPFAVRIERAND
ncbi:MULTISPECIES: cyclophilin-like fold protein [unclassified Acidovorax]|uniref:cyclophilin-like fold protein n=1 Tax=unclassified Acidovorax TaxID=2684926 RepID=UPI0021033D53|nr:MULTISPECIES: cyclophilin-like fold protein [unclassified Acidovorax]QLA79719.1 hypothetical protein EXV95_03060 [Acidovorax sp. JMULE5]